MTRQKLTNSNELFPTVQAQYTNPRSIDRDRNENNDRGRARDIERKKEYLAMWLFLIHYNNMIQMMILLPSTRRQSHTHVGAWKMKEAHGNFCASLSYNWNDNDGDKNGRVHDDNEGKRLKSNSRWRGLFSHRCRVLIFRFSCVFFSLLQPIYNAQINRDQFPWFTAVADVNVYSFHCSLSLPPL